MKEYRIIKTKFNKSVKHVPIKNFDKKRSLNNRREYIDKRIKGSDVSHLSQRDKQYYNSYQSKLKHVQSIPKIITDRMEHYNVYYTTILFGFKTTKTPQREYEEYFKYFYGKLNQLVDSNRNDKTRKSIMIFVPEKSYNIPYTGAFRYQQKASHRLNSPNHYHGFILIHKSNRDRFKRRCVMETNNKGFQLVGRLSDPYPKAICRVKHGNQLLSCYDSLLIPIKTKKDILYTSYYSNKNILKNDFTDENMLYFN